MDVWNAMQTKHLLIVEDNDILSKTLQRYLVGQGLIVTTTRTVAGARDLLADRNFDALLVDICLPDGSGLSLLRPPSKSPMPVIVMTAGDPLSHQQQARDAGAAAFLAKPFPLEVLKRIMKCVLAGHRCLPYCTQVPHMKLTSSYTQSSN